MLEAKPAAKIHGTVVRYPGDTPLAGMECEAGAPSGNLPTFGDGFVAVDHSGHFELSISQGYVLVACHGRHYGGDESFILSGDTDLIVRAIESPHRGRHVAVRFELVSDGAHITKVDEQGLDLRPDDVVMAINGISLAGLNEHQVEKLAFWVPEGPKTTWTIVRAGSTRDVSWQPD